MKNENGSVSFIDPETNSAVAEMMQVVCYDAEQDFAPGDVRITTIKENGIYSFTVIADVNFLTAEDTLYPVSVDPTITLTGTTAIEDAVVYSGKPNSNYGSYHYNSVGYVDDSYKIGRLFVRFPTLASNPTFSSLDIDDITSATLSLYTSSRGTGSESMKLYQYFHTWSESTITWSSANYSTTPLYINTVQFPSASVTAAQIPMTGVVKSWANDNSTLTGGMGIFLDNTSNSDPDLRRSLLSTEYATANNTAVMPCLVIDYGNDLSASIVNLEEGATQTLTVNDAAGYTITWNSSNTTVATVNSSGKITALKAGTSNITATLTNSAGGGRTLTCVAYVYKPNGVYYIRNVYSGYRLTVENAKISNLSNVHISTNKSYIASNPANGLSQMWKLEYQSAGRYRLYPMHKMQSALYASGPNIVIYNSSSASTSNVIWSIEYSSPGYIIRKGGSSDFTLQLASASTAAPLEVVATLSTTSTSAKWLLDEIASPPHGILLYDTTTQTVISSTEDNHPTKYVAPGETLSLTNLKLATSIYADNMSAQSLNWSVVEGTDIATVDGNGNITGVSPGTAVICGQRYVKNDLVQVYITVIVTPVANGTYFIRSRESGKYIDIENQNMEDETILHQWDFHAGDSQRWIFTHLSDGYYSIRSKNSTNSYYLGVKDDSSSAGAAVVLQNGAFTDGMRWRIEITSDGAYRFRSKVCASTEISLALETNSDSNGIDIRQYSYGDDDDYCDEWELTRLLPLSGYELDYNQSLWSGEVQNKTNCYAYAINSQVHYREECGETITQQPGMYAGSSVSQNDFQHPGTNFINKVKNDFSMFSENNNLIVSFSEIGRYEECSPGSYKVALVFAPGVDYHWYRQDSDGLWSHKRGTSAVTRIDNSGNLIVDPYVADRGRYTQFIGYFEVTPWNEYYADATMLEENEQLFYTSSMRNFISYENVNKLYCGMEFSEAIQVMGGFGVNVGSGAIIYAYSISEFQTVRLHFSFDATDNLVLHKIEMPQ